MKKKAREINASAKPQKKERGATPRLESKKKERSLDKKKK